MNVVREKEIESEGVFGLLGICTLAEEKVALKKCLKLKITRASPGSSLVVLYIL